MKASPIESRRRVSLSDKLQEWPRSLFRPVQPNPGRNAREQDGTRTGRDGPHLGTWMGLKCCKTKHMANLDGTPSEPGWDLDGPRIGPRRRDGTLTGPGSDPGEGLDGTPRDSNRLLGLSESWGWGLGWASVEESVAAAAGRVKAHLVDATLESCHLSTPEEDPPTRRKSRIRSGKTA